MSPEPADDRDADRARAFGRPGPPEMRIELLGYDPAWPALYQREAARIRSVLGARALLIEHVGSTSVPGLLAKPIIDIVLGVADSADEPSYVPDLEAGGYTLRLREPEWFEHRLLKGPDTDVNLHVFTIGAPEIERMIAFRDHLEANGADREQYARVKEELAAMEWMQVQDYADAKSIIVGEILERATGPRE